MSDQRCIDWPSGFWRDLLVFSAIVLILALAYGVVCSAAVENGDAASVAPSAAEISTLADGRPGERAGSD